MLQGKLRALICTLLFSFSLTAHAVTVVQRAGTTASSSSTVSTTLTITAGNMILVSVWESNTGSTITPTITDSQGDVFIATPYSIIGNPPGGAFVFVCYNANGGSTVITGNSNGAGTLNWDLIVSEVNGLANHAALAGMTYGWALTSNTQTTDTLTLPAGTYYLYSPVGDLTSGSTYTGTSGFTGHTFSANYIHEVWDQVVTPSTSTSYQNVITSSGTFGGSSANTLLAFSTVAYNNSKVLQVGGGGTALGVAIAVAEMPSNVTVGNYLVAFINGNGNTVAGVSDTMGNTWTLLEGGTSNDTFGLFITHLTSSGPDTISGGVGQSPSLQVIEVTNINGVDVHASAGNGTGTNTSITAGPITTSANNELVLTFGGSETGCNTQGIASTQVNLTWLGEMGAHCSQSLSYQGFAASSGSSYGITTTTSPAGQISATVIAFKPAPSGGAGTQPAVNIIW